PCGEAYGELEEYNGPRYWQAEALKEIGEHRRNPKTVRLDTSDAADDLTRNERHRSRADGVMKCIQVKNDLA
ncbi:hypothetical protein, partial [Proteus mirabilis]|uniref:hypothetical protein n=1 Tax=Proteus mirabilis TaxID=584 RepID=UPI00112F376A